MDDKHVKKILNGIMQYLQKNAGPGMMSLNEITPNIYCSDYETACNAEQLNDNRIYTVISLGDTKSRDVLKAYKERKIVNHQFNIKDDPRQNLADVFMDTYGLIRDAISDGRKVLVHCNAGVSRAPSTIIAYFLRRQYLVSYNKYSDALKATNITDEDRYEQLDALVAGDNSKLLSIIKFVKRVRPCISPNPGFIQQLFLYEQYLKHTIAESLKEIKKSDAAEIKRRKRNRDDDASESDSEHLNIKSESKVKPKPVEYTGRDKLDDLNDLEVSDDEPTPLQNVVATDDGLDNSDTIDDLNLNNDFDPDLEELPVEPKKKDDDFDIDF